MPFYRINPITNHTHFDSISLLPKAINGLPTNKTTIMVRRDLKVPTV